MNSNDIEFKIVRTDRQSFCIESGLDGFVVRAPKKATDTEINEFLSQHKAWIKKQKQRIEKQKGEISKIKPLTDDEILKLKSKAEKIIAEQVAYYSEIIGVKYGKITIRMQKKRWGSCSYNSNLSFNSLLALAPKEVLDSVVVHELCHIKVKNHSKKFYDEVLKVFPEYRKCHRWLKDNGDMLLYLIRK